MGHHAGLKESLPDDPHGGDRAAPMMISLPTKSPGAVGHLHIHPSHFWGPRCRVDVGSGQKAGGPTGEGH